MARRTAPILAALLAALASQADAQAYCQGKVTATLTLDDGRIMLESGWRKDWTTICNINDLWRGIPPQTCWAWFAQANEAMQQDRTLIISYPSLASSADCTTMPTYDNAPRPAYVLALSKSVVPLRPPSLTSQLQEAR